MSNSISTELRIYQTVFDNNNKKHNKTTLIMLLEITKINKNRTEEVPVSDHLPPLTHM